MTVREIRVVREELESRKGAAIRARAHGEAGSDSVESREAVREEERDQAGEMVTLRLRVDQEDEWIWRATKALMEVALDTIGPEEQASALLGEATSTPMNAFPEGAIDWCKLSERVPGWRDPRDAAYCRQRLEWQEEAELICEGGVVRGIKELPAGAVADGVARLAAIGGVTLEGLPPNALDREVREVARRLAAQDLELARGLLRFHRENGWRRLGYASERQHATERLGISRSLVAARRSLAMKLEKLPAIADALEHGIIGVEAAVAIAKVATPVTVLEWIERAQRRTIKHLSEETDAAGMADAGERRARLSASDPGGARDLFRARAGGGEREAPGGRPCPEICGPAGRRGRRRRGPGGLAPVARGAPRVAGARDPNVCGSAAANAGDAGRGAGRALPAHVARELRRVARDGERGPAGALAANVVPEVPVSRVLGREPARDGRGLERDGPGSGALLVTGLYAARRAGAPHPLPLAGRRGRGREPDGALRALPPPRRARGRLSASGLAGRIRRSIGRVPVMVVEGREKQAA